MEAGAPSVVDVASEAEGGTSPGSLWATATQLDARTRTTTNPCTSRAQPRATGRVRCLKRTLRLNMQLAFMATPITFPGREPTIASKALQKALMSDPSAPRSELPYLTFHTRTERRP